MIYNKRIIKINDYLRLSITAVAKMPYVILKDKSNIKKDFFEKIMLAVTEVNGCRICSYAHTKMALESGLSQEEISDLLENKQNSVKDEQAIALLYAKHFADSDGKVSKKAKEKLFTSYSKLDALTIDASANIITFANHVGIAYDLLKNKKNILTSSLKLILLLLFSPIYLGLFLLVLAKYLFSESRNFRLSLIAAIVGLGLGYAYYYFYGCNGTCVIASYANRSAIYFSIIAILISSIFWKERT